MKTGIVSGEIYGTINHPFYDGKKLLMIDLTDETGKKTGKEMIAMDAVDAGVGQPVLILDEGNGARQIVSSTTAPVRSVIVGVIDSIDLVEG